MLRINFMQQWCALSDLAMEDSLYEMESMRRFAGPDLSDDTMPDETTSLRFRHLLEKHGLSAQTMNLINGTLERRARQAGVFRSVSSKPHPLTGANERFNHEMSSIRARVEHVFRVIEHQFGYTKVHCKRITKNAAQVFSLSGLAKSVDVHGSRVTSDAEVALPLHAIDFQ